MDRNTPLATALLTPEEMGEADRLTIEAGAPGIDLMIQAGRAVFDRAIAGYPEAELIHVFCGMGNNGGDGFVVAELLRQAGRRVRVSCLGDPADLTGDAAQANRQWRGDIRPFHPGELDDADLAIDALFGAGLSRDIEGKAAEWINQINASDVPVLAVDLPSGICGLTGKMRGTAIAAEETVTFFRKKPGHLLNPGKTYSGEITLSDIGIEDDVFDKIHINIFENAPGLWAAEWPGYAPDGHKYGRGHTIVLTGDALSTGASRLTATAALRVGAGLTSIAGPKDALMVHAAHLTAIMLRQAESADALKSLLNDPRMNSVAAGPGLGTDDKARRALDAILESEAALTLDADAITLLADAPEKSFERLSARDQMTVLTPHAGEFGRLFGSIDDSRSKLDVTREAAARSGAVVVLKGGDTVIAHPNGKAAINGNAPPWLATAGSGDVLTGIIAGLRAQGMSAFDAACAGVWLHGEAGKRCGAYMVSEELERGLREVLEEDSQDWLVHGWLERKGG